MDGTTTLAVPEVIFWRWVSLLGVIAATFLVHAMIQGLSRGSEPSRAQKTLGLDSLPQGLFILGASLWSLLVLVLTGGLFALVLDVLWQAMAPDRPTIITRFWSELQGRGAASTWDFRFRLAQIAGLTAVLGALVAFPVTLNRLRLARQQAHLADETLFNQKITEAAADLHAQRQVTLAPKDGEARFNAWEDDVVRRNAAIDRLEGLLRERSEVRPDEATAERLARLLSVYIRELSREHPPERHLWMDVRDMQQAAPRGAPVTKQEALERLGKIDEDASIAAMRAWARRLEIRSDMENAARSLGRLTLTSGIKQNTLPIDLEEANLQGARLTSLDFRNASFRSASLQGAHLSWAQVQEANLSKAQMQGAQFREAQMQGADLTDAKMQGAKFSRAQMQGADLREAQMDDRTDLRGANLRGAALSYVNDTTIAKLQPFWQDIFADGTILPGDPNRPAHWVADELEWEDFEKAWREWQHSIGMDSGNPR